MGTVKVCVGGSNASIENDLSIRPRPRRTTARWTVGTHGLSTGIVRSAVKLPLLATATNGPCSPQVGRLRKAARCSAPRRRVRRGFLGAADNGESDLAGYTVYRESADASSAKVASVGASAYTDGNVTAGTAYSYRVTASDASDNESVPSAEASATRTRAVVTRYRPAGFHVLLGSHSSGSVESLYADDGSSLEVSKQGPVNVADYYAHATIAESERRSLRKLTVDFDGHASHSDVAMTLSVYNWRTGGWELVDGPRTGVSSDRSFRWSNATSPGEYVSATGEVRFRVRGERSGGMKTRTDLVRFTVES